MAEGDRSEIRDQRTDDRGPLIARIYADYPARGSGSQMKARRAGWVPNDWRLGARDARIIAMKAGANDTKARARRAKDIMKRAKPGSAPRGLALVSFRQLTPAERAHGKSLAGRARELVSGKSGKLAGAH